MTGAWVVAVLAAAPPLVSGRSPVHYVQAEAWPSALVAEIEAAYAQLPRALRGSELPGGPLEFEYHPHVVTPFGLGTADPLTPEWSNGHRRFHLYARDDEHDSVDRRATWRLRTLSPADRERLWRRRALVHAVMQRIDDERHLSAAAPWRALNGWVLPLERPFTWSERPLNLAVNAYSAGRRDAAAPPTRSNGGPCRRGSNGAPPTWPRAACTKSTSCGSTPNREKPPGSTPRPWPEHEKPCSKKKANCAVGR